MSAAHRERHHGPTQRELLDARSDAIGRLRFPDADDKDGWKKQRALLAIIRGLNRFINKETVRHGAEPNR